MDRNREYVAHAALKREEDAEGGTGTSTEKETETVSIHVKKGNGVQKKAGADDEFEEDDEPAKPVLTKSKNLKISSIIYKMDIIIVPFNIFIRLIEVEKYYFRMHHR